MTTSIFRRHARSIAASTAAMLFIAASTSTVRANIDNTATASGTYNGNTTTSPGDSESVPVITKAPSLSMDKTAGIPTTSAGVSNSITDAGDTIKYTYTIKNTGNVKITGVTPVDTGPTFGGVAGTGSLSAFTLTSGATTLDPNETAVFEATYTLTELDVLHAAGTTNAVSNTATATGSDPQTTTVTSTGDTATTTITAGPALTIAKVGVLNDLGTPDGVAAVGETITYTYTITNTGNVPLTGVAVSDTHEGQLLAASVFNSETLVTDGPLSGDTPPVTSTDATANDGVWSVLQPGAVITIKYVHTVTQAEVDAQ